VSDLDDPDLALWAELDLLRGYAYRDRVVIAAILAGLTNDQLDAVETAITARYNDSLAMASGPAGPALLRAGDPDDEVTLPISVVDALAALAPVEHEFATTTTARRIALDEIDQDTALDALDPVQRIHTLAVLTTAATESALNPLYYKAILESRATWITERTGRPRPYPQPLPV
jgi:hypothetical protein